MALDVDELLDGIDQSLGSAISASVLNSQAIDNLYEAFLFGLVLQAARSIDPSSVAWNNLTGPNGDEVRLRASPGEIYSTKFSFATLSFDGSPVFELHQGVRVRGASGVAHECDIAALHAGRCAWRRGRQEQPEPAELFFAVEAKAYEATRIGLGIGRAVVGLRTDLQQRRVALVAATAIAPSAQALLGSWSFGPFEQVMPGTNQALELTAFFYALLQS